jgi:invasion protein IalB
MKSTGCSQRRRRASGLHAAVGAAAALSLLLMPGAATAQKTNPEVKRTTFDRWEMLCPANACGILTRAVRGMLIVGFSNQTNDVLFQVRLPAEAAEQGA